MKITEDHIRNLNLTTWNKPNMPIFSFVPELHALFKAATESQDHVAAHAYELLILCCGLLVHADSAELPFGDPSIIRELRHLETGKFSVDDHENLKLLRQHLTSSEFRARIGDLLWELNKDHVLGKEAVQDYIQHAEQAMTWETWSHGIQAYTRVLILARKFGKDKALLQQVVSSLTERLNEALSGSMEHHQMKALRLMNLGRPHLLNHALHYAQEAERLAREHESKQDWLSAADFWQCAAAWHRALKDKGADQRCRLAEAETYFSHAEFELNSTPKKASVAAQWLETCIEALRNVENTQERVMQVRQRLDEVQRLSTKELKGKLEVHQPNPLAQKRAVQWVTGKNLPEALVALSQLQVEVDPDQLKKQVEDLYSGTAYLHIPKRMVSIEGRNVEFSNTTEEKIQDLMAKHSMERWGEGVFDWIVPMVETITHEHPLSQSDLIELLTHNPMVRPDRTYSVSLGLLRGFQGDHLSAVHLLIPQLEDSFRYVLEEMNVLTYSHDNDGYQDAYNLNRFLKESPFIEPLTGLLGKGLMYDLRILLVERYGANLRNNVAHGLVGDGMYFSNIATYAWFLCYRFYLLPYWRQRQDA